MRDRVIELSECLDEAIVLQETILAGALRQRQAILAADHELISEVASQMEMELVRLGGVESTRTRVAAELADEIGVVSARWSAIREHLEPSERALLQERVARVEELIRDLELHNAINGQLIGTELSVIDMTIRGLASGDVGSRNRVYAANGGSVPDPKPATPTLLDMAA